MKKEKKRKIVKCALLISNCYFVIMLILCLRSCHISSTKSHPTVPVRNNAVSEQKDSVEAENNSLDRQLKQSAAKKNKKHKSSKRSSSFSEEVMPKSAFFIRKPNVKGVAPLKIDTSGFACHVIRLVDVKTKEVVLDYFIPAGETQEILVPEGTYELRFTSGNKWFGTKGLFGDSATYSKANTPFSFSEGWGYSVTLYAVPYGNLHTQNMDAEDF